MATVRERTRGAGRRDWSTWPAYDAAVTGFRGWWYPVAWASTITKRPTAVVLGDTKIMLMRDGDAVRALHDRCPHRGIPLSMGRQQFPGTLSCAYHGWTFDLSSGRLSAVLTDGPESRICGKVSVTTYPVEQRLGLVWLYLPRVDGDPDEVPHPIDEQLPEELVGTDFVVGGRIDDRAGNWRFAVENGYDEGHAKYLHRTALWRLFKTMPAWNVTHIERRGRWIYRVQDEVHWSGDFPGVGTWTNYRWWKQKPPQQTFNIGNTGAAKRVDPVIAAQAFPGFASLSVPGVLRIAYPNFIHYEFYVPTGPDSHRYVGLMVNFTRGGWRVPWFWAKYLGGIRWLFHGQFSGQDAAMVEATDAPPERLYRPDVSLTEWRKLCEETEAARSAPAPEGGS